MIISLADQGESPLAVQAQQELERRRKQIATDTDGSPRQAIAEAMSLPEFMPSPGTFGAEDTYPRAQALLEIAQKTGKKNPSVAKDALGELRKALVEASPMMQGAFLNDAASEYMEIGDQESAETSLKEALKVAEKLYAVDTDSDNPNRAFKGAWPSTNQWRRCVQLGTKLSTTMVEAIIAGIRDPDIATFQKVYFAGSLLGVASGQAGVAVITKDQESSRVSENRAPASVRVIPETRSTCVRAVTGSASSPRRRVREVLLDWRSR